MGGTYNTLQTQENEIERTLAEIENNLQSRFDTLSGSAESAKLSADLEKEIFTDIAKFRSGIEKADSTNAKVEALNQAAAGFRGILATFEKTIHGKINFEFFSIFKQMFQGLKTDCELPERILMMHQMNLITS